ncbi:MAG: histidine phosphatase family protein [Ilumatobacter sp.]
MELLLIRHGLPVRRELESGAADPELAVDGVEQARRLGEYLASERLDAVYASSMMRARQTAEPVVDGRDLELLIEPDVAEFDKDSSHYVPVEELKATNDPRWQAMIDGTWGGAEDPAEFHDRTVTALDRIVREHRGERVAVVCHGGVINAYIGDALGLPVDARGFFYPNYTSINRMIASSTGVRSLVTLNETSHLRGSGLPMGLFQ